MAIMVAGLAFVMVLVYGLIVLEEKINNGQR